MDDFKLLSPEKGVSKAGNVVLRPMESWSANIHRYLEYLRTEGFPAPRFVGVHESGQEMLEYIEGDFVHPHKWSDEGLAGVGRMVARLHGVGAGFPHDGKEKWKIWYLREIGEGVPVHSHGDIAPWNTVTRKGLPIALIDWETAGPIDPLVELARVCWLFPQLVDDDLGDLYDLPSPRRRGEQVRLICDAYGLEEKRRRNFLEAILEVVICETAHEAIDPGITFESQGPQWGFAWRTRSLYWIWRHRDILKKALR